MVMRMRSLSIVAAIAALCLYGAWPTLAARMPDTWDGLVKVDSDKFDYVYLAPGTDFSQYARVMIDPTEAAFAKNWQRDYNRDERDPGRRISDKEALEALQNVQAGFQDVFTEAYAAAGYQIVTTPAADVLRVRSGVLNIIVAAPDVMAPGRSRTFSSEAGSATLVIELRDSMSGALVARAIDTREIGDTSFMMSRTSVSNRADFKRVFRSWADMSANGVTILRGLPPLSE
jgi:hypothetical protein